MAAKKDEKNLLKLLIEEPEEENIAEGEGTQEIKTIKAKISKKVKPKQEIKDIKQGIQEKDEVKEEIKEEKISFEDLRKELGTKRSGISRSFYLDSTIWIKLIELSEELTVSTSKIVNHALERFFEELEAKEEKESIRIEKE